jgi:recombination protein RecT
VLAYKGLIKRATDTGSILACKPYPIYQGDSLEVRYGLDEDLIHKPSFGDQRGALIGAAVVFIMPDGSKRFHIMHRDEVEKVRNSSAAWKAALGTGPWAEREEQMFLKTVIKQGFRAIPMKSQLRDLLRDDNRLEVGATIESLLAEIGQELPDNLGGGEPDPGAEGPAQAKPWTLQHSTSWWRKNSPASRVLKHTGGSTSSSNIGMPSGIRSSRR